MDQKLEATTKDNRTLPNLVVTYLLHCGCGGLLSTSLGQSSFTVSMAPPTYRAMSCRLFELAAGS